MLKHPLVIVAAVLIAVIGSVVYYTYRVPAEIVTKSGDTGTIAWVSLATAIASMFTALIGLLQNLLDLRKRKREE